MLTVNKTNNPIFGQVNIIKVSKKAFKYPDNLKDCQIAFDKKLNKLNGDKIGSTTLGVVIREILNALFPKSHKYLTHLEGWRNVSLIKKSPEEDYHYFGVYTGEDGQKISQLISKKHGKENARINAQKYTFKDYMKQFSNVERFMSPADKALCMQKYVKEQIRLGFELLSKQIQQALAGKEIHEFKINNLDELKNIKDNLGLNL